MRCQIDLAEASLADQLSERVVPDCLEVLGCEFTVAPVSVCGARMSGAQSGVLLE